MRRSLIYRVSAKKHIDKEIIDIPRSEILPRFDMRLRRSICLSHKAKDSIYRLRDMTIRSRFATSVLPWETPPSNLPNPLSPPLSSIFNRGDARRSPVTDRGSWGDGGTGDIGGRGSPGKRTGRRKRGC